MVSEKDRERFWSKVDKSGGGNACWPWMAYIGNGGYGRLRWEGRPQLAHRVAYELEKETIENKEITHICQNRHCCNPKHLIAAIPKRTPEYFWSKVDKSGGPDACWPWKGSLHKQGYGHIGWDSKTQFAHRIAFALEYENPGKLNVYHLCDNPSCVNPKHLYLQGSDTHKQQQIDRFWSMVDKDENPNSCWNWTASGDSHGYGTISWGSRQRGNEKAHRISYEIHHGPIPDGMFVCHSCDNPACVNPAHLWLGTHADNMRDMFRKNRRKAARGMLNGKSKLTDDQVKQIRKRYAKGGILQRELAEEYGVSDTQISAIITMQRRQNIT